MRGSAIALACTSRGVFALADSCCHEGSSLAEGSLDDTTLTCPGHGWRFDCRSGACLTETERVQPVFETRLRDGRVEVRLPPPETSAEREDAGPGKLSPVERWKQAKHGFDVWADVLEHAVARTPMGKIDGADLERMKWYGYFYRKNNDNEHYMCRVRIPGCELTTEQAKTLAYVAYRSGYSILDVTTRGNVQIQGLTVEALPEVLAALEKARLTPRQSGHDNVRNATSHPFSGFDPEELIDTRALARGIQAALIGSRELADLPRKVNVALVGRPDPAAHAWTQDICFVGARDGDGAVGFQLLLGGTQGKSPRLAWQAPVFVEPGDVVDVTVAVIRTFRELGDRHDRNHVRMRYLIERLGIDGMLGEVETRLGRRLRRWDAPVRRPDREESFVGWFPQKQRGLWALGVCAPLGRLTTYEFEGLAVVARRFGSETLRTTYDQNVVIPDIPEAARREAELAVARHGLSFEPDAALRNVVACTGKQFCNIAVTETKGYAYQLVEELRRRKVQIHGVRLHMSGCPSSCAMNHTADIGLKGAKVRRGLRVLDAFDVSLGGGLGAEVRLGETYRKAVPVSELPELVQGVVAEFHLQRAPGQSFSEYWTRKLAARPPDPKRDVEVPRWQCTRCAHLHVAEDPPPFCPRCAAIRARFEPAPEEVGEPGAPKPGPPPSRPPRRDGPRVLVVGGSIAGHTAAQTVRERDPAARITLVSDEPHTFYNRLNLTRYLAGEVDRRELFERSEEWYREAGIEVLTGTRVIALDPVRKSALLAEGRELAYDACVLAHGSSALSPPFYRDDLPGVHRLRTVADVDAILGAAGPGRRAVVIGGGVLGVEAALGLARRGGEVSVLEWLPRLMPRQLDAAGAEWLAERLRWAGVRSRTGVGVAALEGADRVRGVLLDDGTLVEADLVVVSTGIKPNVEWVRRSGIRCDRGVLADDRMATSAPDVYAAGDVVEWRGRVVGLWTNAIEQARVAGANAAGQMSFFEGFLPVTGLKCAEFPLTSIGEILEDGEGVTSETYRDPKTGAYRRLVLRRGLPVGGLLLGTSAGSGDLLSVVQKGVELERLHERFSHAEIGAGVGA